MAEVECPNCREQVIFPQGEPNVFECPECAAELNWDGKHIIGVQTNRNYLFVGGGNFESHFDSEIFADAIDFANEVMDNDKNLLSEFGGSSNRTITEELILGSTKHDRRVTGVLIVLLIITIGFTIHQFQFEGYFNSGLCCMAFPTVLLIGNHMIPGKVYHEKRKSDLALARSLGGSYGHGYGSGFIRESSIYTRYKWKINTFTFSSFKSISENYFLELSHCRISGGGEYSERSWQGYMWKLRDNRAVIGESSDLVALLDTTAPVYEWQHDVPSTNIETKWHNLERKDLVEDFKQILAIKNQLKKKTGVIMPIKIEFARRSTKMWHTSSVNSSHLHSNIMKVIESDSELSELWKKLKQGK